MLALSATEIQVRSVSALWPIRWNPSFGLIKPSYDQLNLADGPTETVAAARESPHASDAFEMVGNASWAAQTVGAVAFAKTR